MNEYRFTRPPRMMRRAKKENVTLVPGSLLSQKAIYQHIANSLSPWRRPDCASV